MKEVKKPSLIREVFQEALRFESCAEIIETACNLIGALEEPKELLVVANGAKNHFSVFLKLLLLGYFNSLAAEKTLFALFKAVLQKQFYKTYNCPALAVYLESPEGREVAVRILGTAASADPLPPDISASVLADLIGRYHGSSLFSFIARHFASFSSDVEGAKTRVVEVYQKSSPEKRRAMRDFLLNLCKEAISSWPVPLQISFEAWLSSLFVEFQVNQGVSLTKGSFLHHGYRHIFASLRHREEVIDASRSLFDLFLAGLGQNVKVNVKTHSHILKLVNEKECPLASYKRAWVNTPPKGEKVRVILFSEKRVTLVPDALESKHHKTYYSHLFFLMDAALEQLGEEASFDCELLDFLAYNLYNCLDGLASKDKELRSDFIERFDQYLSHFPVNWEIYFHHYQTCVNIFKKMVVLNFYKNINDRLYYHATYLSQNVPQVNQPQFIGGFNMAILVLALKMDQKSGYAPIPFYHMLVILRTFSRSHFGLQFQFRDKTADDITRRIMMHPEIICDPQI